MAFAFTDYGFNCWFYAVICSISTCNLASVFAVNSTLEAHLNNTNNYTINKTNIYESSTVGNENATEQAVLQPKTKEQTLAIMIASIVVAIAIVIFICVAYKFHVIQLDAAKRAAVDEIVACSYPSPCMSRTPRSESQVQNLLRADTNTEPDNDPDPGTSASTARRKCKPSPSPPLLSTHNSFIVKTGSICNSLSDEDVFINDSPQYPPTRRNKDKLQACSSI